jgi:hypothetical protein
MFRFLFPRKQNAPEIEKLVKKAARWEKELGSYIDNINERDLMNPKFVQKKLQLLADIEFWTEVSLSEFVESYFMEHPGNKHKMSMRNHVRDLKRLTRGGYSKLSTLVVEQLGNSNERKLSAKISEHRVSITSLKIELGRVRVNLNSLE